MKKKSITSFREAQDYLFDIPRFTGKNSIDDTKQFLQKLGNPDRGLKIIHVAGTNGKGSTCAYMRSILETAGKKVALFTSPHLVDVRERFVFDGEMISEEEFLQVFHTVYDNLDWEGQSNAASFYHPSFFEFIFFMAMAWFARKHPDYCILETGLGGRLDATNAVTKKELAVITHISMEHVEYLGDTLEKIAGEKAGIMQSGTPVVYWSTCPETDKVFKDRAAKLDISALCVSNRDYQFLSFQNKNIDFSVRTRYYNNVSLTIQTIASYQMENATLAVRALENLEECREFLTTKVLQDGILRCHWPGRMEEVLLEVFLDGAHNADGLRAFLESVQTDGHQGHRTLLFSVVQDKDYELMISELVSSGLFRKIAIAHMHTGRALSLEKLEQVFQKTSGCEYCLYEDVGTAFKSILQQRIQGERVYIAGSLYLAGEIKELLRNDQF